MKINILDIFPLSYQSVNLNSTNFIDKQLYIFKGEFLPTKINFRSKFHAYNFKTDQGIITVYVFFSNFYRNYLRMKSILCSYNKKNNYLVLEKASIYRDVYDKYPKIMVNYRKKDQKYDFKLLIDQVDQSFIDLAKYLGFDLKKYLFKIHFPESKDLSSLAFYRSQIEYLRCLRELVVLKYLYRFKLISQRDSSIYPSDIVNRFEKLVGFTFSSDQKRSMQAIVEDFAANKRMIRYLIADVGTGKSVVAYFAIWLKYLKQQQVVLLSPSITLSSQHYQNLLKIINFDDIISLNYKSSDTKLDYKKLINEKKVIVTTKTINKYKFDNLALIIVDEEQKFGVNERNNLINQNPNSDLLVMTATCIPRTALMIRLLDIAYSTIEDRQTSRKISTFLVDNDLERNRMNQYILDNISTSNQLFIICPSVKENEKMVSVESIYQRLASNNLTKKYRIKMIHGKTEDSVQILQDFNDQKFEILIATTVIEVGIDIKNANNIIIYDADRYGIANLQQLRGRIARHHDYGRCYLISDNLNAKERLEYFVREQNGMKLVEYDLNQRGAGELLGLIQSGKLDLPERFFNSEELLKQLKIESSRIVEMIDNFPRIKEYAASQKINLN